MGPYCGMTDGDGSKPTVLLCEDEYIVALDLQLLLEEFGYEVIGPFDSFSKGLNALNDVRPDMAVLDVRLRAHIDAEHAAMRDGDSGRALMLSGEFHIQIARIADQDTIEDFIRQLISRSSLVIALYWRRQTALCESHAHDALIEALARGDGIAAEELMSSHLVDLLSLLDLRQTPPGSLSLKDALA